jgi:hypothetical protein
MLFGVLAIAIAACRPDTYDSPPYDPCTDYQPVTAEFEVFESTFTSGHPYPWLDYDTDTSGRINLRFVAKYNTSDMSAYQWTIGQDKYYGKSVSLSFSNYKRHTFQPKLVIKKGSNCGDNGIDSIVRTITILANETKIAGNFVGFRDDGLPMTLKIDTTIRGFSFPNDRPSIIGLSDTCTFYISNSTIGWKQWVFTGFSRASSSQQCGAYIGRIRLTDSDSLIVEYQPYDNTINPKKFKFHGKKIR